MRKATLTQHTQTDTAEALSRLIVQGMIEKKAQDIVVLDLRQVKNAVADFFILSSGTSDTQLDAITDSVEEIVHRGNGENPWHREGKMGKEWIILDYGDCVAHVFKKPRRQFYSLEQLWGDAKIIFVDENGHESLNPPIAIAVGPTFDEAE